MKHNYQITPSIYCANTADLKTEIKKLMAAGITWIHFDVMDGHFVQNYALGPKELIDIKTMFPTLTIDVHVMANDLLNKVKLFTTGDYLTFHLQSVKSSAEMVTLIKEIKSYNLKVGIALDLADEINDIKPFLKDIDLITFMSIKPGFTGQSFDDSVWAKLAHIKTFHVQYPHLSFQIDGGVRWENLARLIRTGIDLIVVGSLLFSSDDYQAVMQKIALLN
ncbi:ribulose-phosphate 3-epimerase [Spiroplasma eriocheiris]|uniref:Ribulose-phosphate 3-epimerase n=1 Tax=Spiroplasma eriocheiris TaxID=315358 RepID=A0A0H3XLT3_9MOLU|nr:ribulose-phosphate 3-epimerase [Spiroplasma eriocheiris]AHF58095.1 ribulose-phosphate 3-epimerase [Spiroplasma eriocheiris CCTCC M 207170]AKM54534.1 ribulose-phosphate 3-epimerase [Spiroplasma eriocheiris]